MQDDLGSSIAGPLPSSIEGRASWIAAGVALVILSVAYGSTLLIVVGLRAMEIDLDVSRSILALAGALTWIGTGLGGIVMGWLANRIGVRNNVLMGTVMVASGLALSSTGHVWALFVGHGVLIGFLGMGAIYPPLVIYVSRWFDGRRGTAIALISSGQYVAGGDLARCFRATDRRARLADRLSGLCGRCVAGRLAARHPFSSSDPWRV